VRSRSASLAVLLLAAAAAASPDGSELAFASNVTGEYAVYRQRLSDGQAWRVTFGPGPARYPDYRPLHRTGSAAGTASRPLP
jgi:Tol biopolymer transport system component